MYPISRKLSPGRNTCSDSNPKACMAIRIAHCITLLYVLQFSVAGQVALITGASSGIGEATAWRLADLGCSLILCARRQDRLETLKTSIEKQYKVPIHIAISDVSDTAAVNQLPDELPPDFRDVDILVNNAGLALGTSPVHENDVEDCVKMINTNVTAVAILTRKFSPGMVKRNRGHIVNISSIAAHWTYTGGSIYCGSKHFIDAFTNAARHDLVGSNVRVTSISPGAVKTEFANVRYKGDDSKAESVYEGMEPLTAADAVVYAVTRPPHVQVGEVILYATNQSSPQSISRALKTKSLLEELTDQLTGTK